ncbi:MAG: peptide deformylase [Deltaproteobacteria bacterium]|nr:peptide deformylase [Deltaproteobacteria bacterium]
MKILIYPDEILAAKAQPVTELNDRLLKLVEDMFETMYKAKGIGLAANQVGVLQQVVIMDLGQRGEDAKPDPIVLINPVITASEGEICDVEGCLSVPDYSEKVKRAQRIQVMAYDQRGKEIRMEAEGLLARCIQHELDHLNGICFVERLSPLKRAFFRKKWSKMSDKG